jgi:hypothetical protein
VVGRGAAVAVLAFVISTTATVAGARPARTAPAAGPTAATPVYTGRIGLSTNTIGMQPQEAYPHLREARSAGVTWVREDFPWNYMEPQRGKLVWRYTDGLMANASRLGIDVLAVLAYSSAWASGWTDSYKHGPRDVRTYASFARLVAIRYGRGGTFWKQHRSLQPRPLKAIEIWNEPWHHGFWKPEPDPQAYAQLVRAAATAVKAVHPEVAVLASADVFQSRTDTADSPDWFAALLRVDPALWQSRLVNGWSVHLYCQRLSPLDSAANPRFRCDRALITRDLAAAARASKPIWVTEAGWRADQVGEANQALYTRLILQRAATDWRSFVLRTFVYHWNRPRGGGDDPYNLIRPDGSTRPAWQEITSLLANPRDQASNSSRR